MEIIITIVAFLLLVGIIVAIHEGGHFIIGKWCGIKMLEFSLGFGPKIFQRRFGADKTLFTLRLLPLGGFVKPLDESSVSKEEWKEMSETEKSRSFLLAAKWKKILMVAGGPFSNFVLAFFVYLFAMTFVGTKGLTPIIADVVPNGVFANAGVQAGDEILAVNGTKVKVMGDAYSLLVNGMIQGQKLSIITNRSNNILIDFSNVNLKDLSSDINATLGIYFKGNIGDVVINSVNQDSPAAKAGLKAGDKLISINKIEFNEIGSAIRFISKNSNKELTVVVEREKKLITLPVIPNVELIADKKIGRIGVQFELKNEIKKNIVYYSLNEAMWNSSQRVLDSSYTTLISIKKLVLGELSVKTLSGPIAIADYSGKSAHHGLFQYLMMIAAISIAVGVFNLLPIPALDGGHLVQYTIEYITGYDVPYKVMHYSQIVGFGMVMCLFGVSIFNDITKYFF
jgi:regulator of sigma E protease